MFVFILDYQLFREISKYKTRETPVASRVCSMFDVFNCLPFLVFRGFVFMYFLIFFFF